MSAGASAGGDGGGLWLESGSSSPGASAVDASSLLSGTSGQVRLASGSASGAAARSGKGAVMS